MDTKNVVGLEERVARLERRNQRLQKGMFALAILAVLPWSFAATFQSPAGIVRAQELQMMSGDTVYASLRPARSGIGFYDRSGREFLKAFSTARGGALAVLNERGKEVVEVYSSNISAGTVRVSSSESAYSASMFSRADNSGAVQIADTRATVVAGIGLGSHGKPVFSATSWEGKPLFQAGVDENGGFVGVLNLDGVPTAQLANQPSARPMLRFYSRQSRPVMDLLLDQDTARLKLFDVWGSMLRSLPDR